jgi:hypothetical protein
VTPRWQLQLSRLFIINHTSGERAYSAALRAAASLPSACITVERLYYVYCGVLRRRLLKSLNAAGRPSRAVAVKRLRRSFASFRPLRSASAIATGRWVFKASTPQTGAPRRVGAVEAVEAYGLIRAQRSSLAEGDARKRAWA